ncbi:succinyl-diaminopimelate desuccinylase [Lichenicoccus sp.]|uniref:succinyl-diaminopimelate desuccinylase n=1 Tax=Lichenicoccus sp. TaxID=2781899 RepID=UPI003D12D239
MSPSQQPALGTAAVALAQALIRAQSVTPADGGAQAVLAEALSALGFTVTHLPFGAPGRVTPNLFARIGAHGPHLCFAGHTDVVPPGEAAWSMPPFAGAVRDGVLYGRGACDMKGAIAAFVAAVARHLRDAPAPGDIGCSISLLITGDEEGPATDGTVRVLEWMRANGQVPDFCLVGEPTNPGRLGEVIKVGRRGSLNAAITIEGVQGHVAYPHRADNPVHRLVSLLAELAAHRLDDGNAWFEPSGLQITSVDVGNAARNVIPARASAQLNIRFNDIHSGRSLQQWLREVLDRHASGSRLEVQVSGEAFLTRPGPYVAALAEVVRAHTGTTPRLDTGGGTSDARFIARTCPVAEFGLVGASMHKADENVSLTDLEQLVAIYRDFLVRVAQPDGQSGAASGNASADGQSGAASGNASADGQSGAASGNSSGGASA